MNFKIYILAIACFVTGMVELIVGGCWISFHRTFIFR